MKSTPFQIVWSPLALARLQEIRAYVALDKPDAAERLAIRIITLVEALRTNPHLGRVGPESAIRELILGGTPYPILYRISHISLPHHHHHGLALHPAEVTDLLTLTGNRLLLP